MVDNFKPTLGSKPTTELGKKYTSNFNKTMSSVAPNVKLNEVEGLLTEKEQSLKKKIFSLAKMEALVFSDPKLSAVYDSMSENGEEKYGYHYNETIMNMLFNDYVLNSAKYLQKYKQAIPKEKKRRDASGINQLKKAGEETMQTRNVEPKAPKPLTEEGAETTKVMFLVNETDPENHDVFAYFPEEKHDVHGEYNVGYSHVGQHSAVHPAYAAESRPATPEEYQDLKAELESIGYNLEVIEGMNEMTGTGGGAGGAFSGSGQFTAPLGYKKPVDETTTSASSGAYVGPAMWGGGDLMKTKGKANVKKVPMVKGGTIIQESTNYLVDPSGFEKFVNELNEQVDISAAQKSNVVPYKNNAVNNKIIDKTSAFTSNTVKKWNKPDTEIELGTVDNGTVDEPNFKTMEENKNDKPVAMKGLKPQEQNSVNVNEDSQSMIGDSPDTMANKPAPVGTQSSNMDTGLRASGGMNEAYETLLEELNNELNAFSIHQDKLKKMTEDRKPSALVLKDRLGDENKKNFKKDLQHSGTKEIIDVEKELQWKDQQTEIGEDPYKLGQDIEDKAIKTGDMKSGEALKNVGDSANEDGDEIPKRNLTQEEQDEVNLYRKGLGDLVYDNEPGERFEERMKADMGDKLYKQRQDKLKFNANAPMYNKDTQPTEKGIEKQQFDKEKSGWNEREGLKESIITGKYFNNLGKKVIVEFNLNEVQELPTELGVARQIGLFEVGLEGLGNTYTQKVSVNESAVKAMDMYKFFTDGDKIFAMKNPVQNLSEAAKNEKPVVNEQFNKMKHLLNYKPDTFMNTDNTKKNRGF